LAVEIFFRLAWVARIELAAVKRIAFGIIVLAVFRSAGSGDHASSTASPSGLPGSSATNSVRPPD
jgi:hypothetical protein